METPAISCGLPFCWGADEVETNYSLIIRITAAGLGGIAVFVGSLALGGISGLQTLGAIGGGISVAGGGVILLAALCMRCVKRITESSTQPDIANVVPAAIKADSPDNSDPKTQPEAILYMSISGNPAHLGHMAAMGTAIKELQKKQIKIKKAFVSLSSQAYVEEKQKRTVDKICYTYQERIQFLQYVIQEAKKKKMFDSVEVEFWDDQVEGYSDHPLSYEKLAKENPLNKVFLITGSDLCRSMANWKTEKVAHAIIVTRGAGDKETTAQKDSNGTISGLVYQPTGERFVEAVSREEKSRILLPNTFPEYEHYSSTAIRTKRIHVTYEIPSTPVHQEVAPISSGSLQAISDNTMQLMEQGFCQIPGKGKIHFKTALELHQSSSVVTYDQIMQPVAPKYAQRIFVMENDCLEVAQKLTEQGQKVAVVNFAGSDSAGGGFLEGTGGQEERIIYRCDLANLMKYYFDEQIRKGKDFKMYPLYDHLILTPGITVFRNKKFEVLKEPFSVGILTSAAPVSKQFCPLADTAFEIVIKPNGEVDYADEKTRDLMRRTIYAQLKAAYDAGYEAIVLGAFGCGAFQNPPEAVATIYREVIDTYFKGAFKTIVFAILDGARLSHNPKGNVQPFRTCFPDKPSL